MEFLIKMYQRTTDFEFDVWQFVPSGLWIRHAATYHYDYVANQAAYELMDLLIDLGAIAVYLDGVQVPNET